MKSIGIVRKIDELGRIVLPVELRKTLGIEIKDSLEICVDGQCIILSKYESTCSFCGGADDLKTFKNKMVCQKCAEEINK